MTRTRTTALAFAAFCSTCAILAAFLLHAGSLKSGVLLAEVVKTSWSVEQIEAFIQYAGPLSMLMVALSLAMMVWSTLRARKQ
jgi:hypothetical protein